MRQRRAGRGGRLRARAALALAAWAAITAAGAAGAAETTTYRYDELGQLVATTSTGTVNNGLTSSTGYDPAGNRSSYVVTGAGGGSPPPPSNQPPVANPDSLTAPKCVLRQKDVIANDTDPDGHYPLVLTAVSQPWARVESSTVVGIETPAVNGTYVITYTVADSLGATSNGTLTLTVSGTQPCV
jgi:Bacterial Ig domain